MSPSQQVPDQSQLQHVEEALKGYTSLDGARKFFASLGYEVIEPLSRDDLLGSLSRRARKAVTSIHQLVELGGGSRFGIYHIELAHSAIRRTDIRCFLESLYRHWPQGNNLFVFNPEGRFEDLAFVSPRRLPDPRNENKVRLWLRTLQVQPQQPYRTDLEVLDSIRIEEGLRDPFEIWERHEKAFSVQRVTEQFYADYAKVFDLIRTHLSKTHGGNSAQWARDYAHQLLNRIMFLYFVARKRWLRGPDGQPDRNFMRDFWEAYRDSGARNAFHDQWLRVLFFEAFNNKWQNRTEYKKRFPDWLITALSQAPFLNGGLYSERNGVDDRLEHPLPDMVFELLFERWTDGTFPGLFERYNFTVVESGRFDEEVAVDPEMLGTVYERLVNVTFAEEADPRDQRRATGVFYTPRVEIDLMCRLALVDWLGNHLPHVHKDLLCEWVFAATEEEKKDADQKICSKALWEPLSELVRRVRICDPACGSGSFLVGMMLALDDLQARCNEALGEDETPYERRKRILQDQLYGVDVMEWAVRVAELRLWLQLVVETELHSAELRFRPLLPNLDFKLRPGDSLLQMLGDVDLSHFRRAELRLSRSLKGRLTRLRGDKRKFFQGEEKGLSAEALKKEELDLFRDIIDERIHSISNQIKSNRQSLALRQKELIEPNARDEKVKDRVREDIRRLTEQLERLKKALRALRPDQPPPFVWDLAFVEVFEDEKHRGFDIVIGNPPYVRQERIQDYLGRCDRRHYLDRLNEGLRAIYPGFLGKKRRIGGRADYYVYFYLHGLSLLADGGSFCFITSNSWLDVDFGKDLQEFFLRHCHLKMVIDNRAKRSFSHADVNTVIVLAGTPTRHKPLNESEMAQRLVRFVAFNVPFEEAMSPVVFEEVEDERRYRSLARFRVLKRPEFRSVLWDQKSLYLEGLAEEGPGRYVGDKWGGKYLRAPDIFFTILQKGEGKLVRLGEIAEVRFGIKTGANEFFYLEPLEHSVAEVARVAQERPRASVPVENGAGWQGRIEAAWLQPVIKSPREIRTLRVRIEDLHYLVFMPPPDVRRAIEKGNKQPWGGYPLAAAYIRWGEKQGYRRRPTCRSRPMWWDLGVRDFPTVVWVKSVNDSHRQGLILFHALVDQRLYELRPEQPRQIAALINAAMFFMVKELYSRVNLGEGALDTTVYEANTTLTVSPSVLSCDNRSRLVSALGRLAQPEVKSIFEEFGFPLCHRGGCREPEHPYERVKPEELTLEQVRKASPDRYELDRVIFDVLGLTDDERLQVYQAVVQLVKDRLLKARSV